MSPTRPGAALFPLRLFLGLTFVYAGVQKLTDPGFLHPGAPTYIGTQLHAFAAGTPGGFLLRTFAIPHAQLAGVGVAIAEIVIGLLAVAGLLTRVAALAGLGLNLVLFLTASWHTTPYFLGPDIVFVFAWLPFVLCGAEGQPALDNVLEHPSESLTRRTRLHPPAPGEAPGSAEATMTRRVLVAETAVAGLAIAGISALLKGPFTGSTATARSLKGGSGSGAGARGPSGSASSNASPTSAGGGSGSSAASGLPPGAVKLGPASRLPRGQAATYADPADGSPDILIRESDGSLKAFSAVCTHAGCTVGYDGSEIYCPCHGGTYSAESGEVTGGPPPAPLAPKEVLERGGQIYAVPT
jgi:thiosulfate dehydrogenase (quinone) large subunit